MRIIALIVCFALATPAMAAEPWEGRWNVEPDGSECSNYPIEFSRDVPSERYRQGDDWLSPRGMRGAFLVASREATHGFATSTKSIVSAIWTLGYSIQNAAERGQFGKRERWLCSPNALIAWRFIRHRTAQIIRTMRTSLSPSFTVVHHHRRIQSPDPL